MASLIACNAVKRVLASSTVQSRRLNSAIKSGEDCSVIDFEEEESSAIRAPCVLSMAMSSYSRCQPYQRRNRIVAAVRLRLIGFLLLSQEILIDLASIQPTAKSKCRGHDCRVEVTEFGDVHSALLRSPGGRSPMHVRSSFSSRSVHASRRKNSGQSTIMIFQIQMTPTSTMPTGAVVLRGRMFGEPLRRKFFACFADLAVLVFVSICPHWRVPDESGDWLARCRPAPW